MKYSMVIGLLVAAVCRAQNDGLVWTTDAGKE
jgi:hypothetical protein